MRHRGVSDQGSAGVSAGGRSVRLVPAGIAVRIVTLLCGAAIVAGVYSPPASASTARGYLRSFGAFGAVAGVAVDQKTGDVYVYDGGDGAIYKFDALGNPVDFTSTASNEITGVPTATGSEAEIAVDDSSGPAKGDIYVAHAGANVLIYNEAGEQVGEINEEASAPWGEACGVAVGSSGAVYVGLYPSAVNKYVPTSPVVKDSDYAGSYEGLNSVCNVAVDPAGNLFVDSWSSGPIRSYAPSQLGAAQAEGSVVGSPGTTLAVDPATEDVFADEQDQISQYGPNGTPHEEPLYVFGASGAGALTGSSTGIAVNESSNEVYAASGAGAVNIYSAPLVFPAAKTGGASNVAAESATVSGEADPEGVAIEECYFQYGESTSYGQTAPCVEEPAQIGSGTEYVKVHAELSGLTSGVKYHFRLVATNKNGSVYGTDATFVWLTAKIEGDYAFGVSATGATLGGSVKAEKYYFEYGTTSAYGMRTKRVEQSGESVETLQVHIGELLPETTYHYAIVATSAAGTIESPDLTFTTQGPGGPLQLLDGRQWELVSPTAKYGAGIVPQRFEGDVIQAAEDGDGLVYMSQNPIESEPEGNRAPEATQILARRLPGGGWSSRTMTTPNDTSHGLPLGVGTEYKFFSPNLTEAILEPTSTEALAPGVTQRTLYLRTEAACSEKSTSCFTPLLTTDDTAPGAVWDPGPEGVETDVHFTAATPGLKHVLIEARTALTEGAPERGLYEWSEGHLQLVSVNESGEKVDGAAGSRSELNVRGAISTDGSRVFFCAANVFGCEYEGELEMRDTATQESVRLDPPTSTSREFQIANEDGSRAFFTYEEGYPHSYLAACEFVEVGGKLTCKRSEVAPEPVGSVLGINEDGSTVYFVSKAALAGEATAGEDNLYVSHLQGGKWVPSFIVTLNPEDEQDWGSRFGDFEISHMTSRVSTNGRFLAFMSDRELTKYNNRDAVSGEPDQEVFLYDDQHPGKLTCASCNPTGGRPEGLFYGSGLERALVNSQGVWENVWIAASLPTWDNMTLSRTAHQTSYLNDEGRLFFNSSDALVPQDTNGLADVYEYEPEDVGSCARGGGCVQLVSSGTAREESVFLDASASGNDVFFISPAQLTGQDNDTAYDVYDAHVCTTAVPCEQTPVSPPPCDSGESCKAAPTPQPSIFGTPPSATFSGAGNLAPPAPVPSSRAKPTARAQGLGKALEACRKDKSKSKRSSCEKRARRRYGSKAKKQAKPRKANSDKSKAHKGGK
jgi:hypothetical protein